MPKLNVYLQYEHLKVKELAHQITSSPLAVCLTLWHRLFYNRLPSSDIQASIN